jgi:hypothetical protein
MTKKQPKNFEIFTLQCNQIPKNVVYFRIQ